MTQTTKRLREASGPGYRLVQERVEGAVFWQLVSGPGQHKGGG